MNQMEICAIEEELVAEQQNRGNQPVPCDADWIARLFQKVNVSTDSFYKRINFRERILVFEVDGNQTSHYRKLRKQGAASYFILEKKYEAKELANFLFAHFSSEYQEENKNKYVEQTLCSDFESVFKQVIREKEKNAFLNFFNQLFQISQVSIPVKNGPSMNFEFTIKMDNVEKTFECKYFNPESYLIKQTETTMAMQYLRPYSNQTVHEYFEGWNKIKSHLFEEEMWEEGTREELNKQKKIKIFEDILSNWKRNKEFQLRAIGEPQLKAIQFRIY